MYSLGESEVYSTLVCFLKFMPGYEFFSVTTVMLGIYEKEVEEEVFENGYVFLFFFNTCQESGL